MHNPKMAIIKRLNM